MTNGKPFFLGNSYGKGRVFSCIAHPEATPAVRIRAAQYVANTHYLHFLPDMRSSVQSETDEPTKKELKTQLDRLEALLNPDSPVAL